MQVQQIQQLKSLEKKNGEKNITNDFRFHSLWKQCYS